MPSSQGGGRLCPRVSAYLYSSPAADVWEEKGAVPEAFNSMVHLISDDDTLTLVVDRMNLEMEQLSDAIRSQLTDVILYDPAFKEAA